MTYAELAEDALREIRVLNAVDGAADPDQDLALVRINRILDNWSADGRAIWAQHISAFVITPSLQPHTIGPTGTWTLSKRPEFIDRANLIVTNSTRRPLQVRDAEWWMGLPTPTLSGSDPTDLYYEREWPNGSVYLWPVPTTAYQVELLLQEDLSGVTVLPSDTVSLPPGYTDALMLTLAESLAPSFRVQLDPITARRAMEARARAFGNASRIPRLNTRDAGIPGGRRSGSFNYLRGY
jgi:hypothetical protein